MTADQQSVAELVRYSAWASKKLLDFTSTVPEADLASAPANSHGGILKTFQHIYYADRIWLARLERAQPKPFADPEPGPPLAELDRLWWPLLERMAALLETSDTTKSVTFQRLNGETMTLAMYRIVQHVVNHGTYHRGQIAAMLKQSGHTPPSTDLVFFQPGL